MRDKTIRYSRIFHTFLEKFRLPVQDERFGLERMNHVSFDSSLTGCKRKDN